MRGVGARRGHLRRSHDRVRRRRRCDHDLDLDLSLAPDATTALGFDHHGASYRMLHCGCRRQYLYSLREDVLDSDVGHDADTGLGAWTATRGCEVGEGGTLELHAAMR